MGTHQLHLSKEGCLSSARLQKNRRGTTLAKLDVHIGGVFESHMDTNTISLLL